MGTFTEIPIQCYSYVAIEKTQWRQTEGEQSKKLLGVKNCQSSEIDLDLVYIVLHIRSLGSRDGGTQIFKCMVQFKISQMGNTQF